MQPSCNYTTKILFTLAGLGFMWVQTSPAQESPFFVTYTHHMEEPGNLDLETSTTAGVARRGQVSYFAPYLEMEYGVTARWTTEFYLEGQSSAGDSAVFTGWRWEHRYRPLMREHRINPVLYVEYADLNEASRIQKEVEGGGPDLVSRNALLTPRRDHELESRLILSSDCHDWNISENFIAAKNFSQSEGIEFGYALGVSRPLGTLASGANCRLCRENFALGGEMYGGLGSTRDFSARHTAHYLAPVLSWTLGDHSHLRLSPGVGLTHESSALLLRFGYTYEIQGLGGSISKLFGRRP